MYNQDFVRDCDKLHCFTSVLELLDWSTNKNYSLNPKLVTTFNLQEILQKKLV